MFIAVLLYIVYIYMHIYTLLIMKNKTFVI